MFRTRLILLVFGLVLVGLMACAPTPTAVPPTAVPPTVAPATAIPPTEVPPTEVPPTLVPPTATATALPTNTPPPSPTETKQLTQSQSIGTMTANTRVAADATKATQPTPDSKATTAAAQAASTAKAESAAATTKACLEGAATPQDWTLVLCDLFAATANGWNVQAVNSEAYEGTRAIKDGQYVWDITAKRGVVITITPRMSRVTDFFANVTATRTGGDASSEYCLVYRQNGENYYLYCAKDDGSFVVNLRSNGTWTSLLKGQGPSAGAGQANRLGVEAKGNLFALYLNDTVVGTVQDGTLKEGVVGLANSYSAAGQKATLVFDQFVVLKPGANSKARPPIAASAAQPTQPPVVAQPTAPPASGGCPLDPGNAGIYVVNQFDGLMTFTVLDHEYKLEPHTEQLVQVPGGQEFTASVSVQGVGKTNFGPIAIPAGSCELYKPNAG